MGKEPLYGCVEAGGTKLVCAVAAGVSDLRREAVIPTTDPETALANVRAFFLAAEDELGACAAYGVASFGPLCLDRGSRNWGHITTTPKPGWTGVDMLSPFRAKGGRWVSIPTSMPPGSPKYAGAPQRAPRSPST